jgi:hypothetical protein
MPEPNQTSTQIPDSSTPIRPISPETIPVRNNFGYQLGDPHFWTDFIQNWHGLTDWRRHNNLNTNCHNGECRRARCLWFNYVEAHCPRQLRGFCNRNEQQEAFAEFLRSLAQGVIPTAPQSKHLDPEWWAEEVQDLANLHQILSANRHMCDALCSDTTCLWYAYRITHASASNKNTCCASGNTQIFDEFIKQVYSQRTIWTEELIVAWVSDQKRSPTDLSKPLFKMWARQTRQEQAAEETIMKNKRGFNMHDAKFAASLIETFRNHRNFTPKQCEALKKLLIRYRRQLTEIANGVA